MGRGKEIDSQNFIIILKHIDRKWPNLLNPIFCNFYSNMKKSYKVYRNLYKVCSDQYNLLDNTIVTDVLTITKIRLKTNECWGGKGLYLDSVNLGKIKKSIPTLFRRYLCKTGRGKLIWKNTGPVYVTITLSVVDLHNYAMIDYVRRFSLTCIILWVI